MYTPIFPENFKLMIEDTPDRNNPNTSLIQENTNYPLSKNKNLTQNHKITYHDNAKTASNQNKYPTRTIHQFLSLGQEIPRPINYQITHTAESYEEDSEMEFKSFHEGRSKSCTLETKYCTIADRYESSYKLIESGKTSKQNTGTTLTMTLEENELLQDYEAHFLNDTLSTTKSGKSMKSNKSSKSSKSTKLSAKPKTSKVQAVKLVSPIDPILQPAMPVALGRASQDSQNRVVRASKSSIQTVSLEDLRSLNTKSAKKKGDSQFYFV